MKKSRLLLILSLSTLMILSGCQSPKKPTVQGSANVSSTTSTQKSKKTTATTSSESSSGNSATSSSQATAASSSSTDVDAQTQDNSPTNVTENRAATNHIVSADSYAYSAAEVQTAMTGQPTTITQPTVFLTFDDGVNQTMTPRVLQTLAEQQVHATFFVVGNTLTNAANQNMLQQEYQAGHGIAVHSYDHNYNLLYPNRVANAAAIVREYQQTNMLMTQILGNDFTTKVWRYPGGHMSWRNLAPADAQLKQLGVTWIYSP